jgi:hypothetical protein
MENLNNIKEFLIELNNSIDSKTREELQAETNSIHSILNEYLPESKWYLGDLVTISGNLALLGKMKNDVEINGKTLENQKLTLKNLLNSIIKHIDIIGLPGKKIKDDHILEYYNTNFLNWKNQLLQFPLETHNRDNFLFDINLFRKTKLCKSHFSSTINNPFRILALKHNATDKEIAKRISDLLVYAEMGIKPKYDTDLFFGEINRRSENITDAAKKLEYPTQKLYYALLWYIELSELDKAFLKKIQALDKGEITPEFKSDFIKQAPDFFENRINYFDAVKKVYELMFLNAQKLNEDFIDDLQSEKEEISFCLNDEIISLIPLNDNSVRINNEIVLNSNTDNGFWLLNETYFDYKVDYEIEFECEWLEGQDTNKLYSIVFSKDSGNNYYRFGMSANKFLYFDAVVNGINQNLYGWKRLNDFYFKSKNKLKIAFNSERNEFEFFINDKIVREKGRIFGIKALEKPLTGNIIGVSVLGKQKVSFSNIKLSYTHRISKPVSKFKVRSSNISSAINYITANLCAASFIKEFYHYLPSTIAIFGKLVNSEVFHLFASKIIDEHRKIDIQAIERYFIDDIYSFTNSQFDNNEFIRLNEFIDAFYSFSDMNQSYIVHKFIGKPIFDIEESISNAKHSVKNTPLQGLRIGFDLYKKTIEDLMEVRRILSYTNYHYKLLANNIANAIVNSVIIFFNARTNRNELSIYDCKKVLELMTYSNSITFDSKAKKRIDENTEIVKRWIINNNFKS